MQDRQNISGEVPTTTGFAVMFLPTEGLFAEVVRRPGLVDDLQSTFHVCLAGPTTLAAGNRV